MTSDWNDKTVIKSSGPKETAEILRRFQSTVYVSLHPKVTHASTNERPITSEQRVTLRCFEPPPLRPPVLKRQKIKEGFLLLISWNSFYDCSQ